MNAYMRGFVILFVLLVLLSYLPPGKQYRKYIRFYAQLLMVLAALRPLFVLFGGKNQTPTTESQAKIYNPGTYSLELTLNDTLLNMEVVVDSDRVKSVSLKNIDDSVTTMFPLLTPSLANIEKQLVNETDPENVILSDDSRYTEMMLLESVKEVLKKARV